MTSILVTGGCGFIGSNFVRYMLRNHPAYTIVNFDKLTYAGNSENLADVDQTRTYHFVKGDICSRSEVQDAMARYHIDAVVNFAAESHVDRSIMGPAAFVETNIGGTAVLLDAARESGVERFLQVSTDEVYGSLGPTGKFTESSPLRPNSPYAASKASADLLAHAYHKTFGVPVVITRCSNNFGPYQFPEKLIPLMIANAIDNKPLPVYGDGLYVRDWLYVEDHCSALDAVLHRGGLGEVYNIGGNNEMPNLEMVKTLLKLLEKPESLISFVKDRPGHDRRYAIDQSRIMSELGWKPTVAVDDGLSKTVRWYVEHETWWRRVMSGAYREYYRKMYQER